MAAGVTGGDTMGQLVLWGRASPKPSQLGASRFMARWDRASQSEVALVTLVLPAGSESP